MGWVRQGRVRLEKEGRVAWGRQSEMGWGGHNGMGWDREGRAGLDGEGRMGWGRQDGMVRTCCWRFITQEFHLSKVQALPSDSGAGIKGLNALN